MRKIKKLILSILVIIMLFSTVNVSAVEKELTDSKSNKKENVIPNVDNNVEMFNVKDHTLYDENNDEYRIILQLDGEGYLYYVYSLKDDQEYYNIGEMQTSLSRDNITDKDLRDLAKRILKKDIGGINTERKKTRFMEGTSIQNRDLSLQNASLARAKRYMREFSEYRAPVNSKLLGSVTRNGVTARVSKSVIFNAWEVGYVNYNSGTLIIDIALNLGLGPGTVLDIVSHTAGLMASKSGNAGFYRGENISTKIVSINGGTWYNAGMDTNYKVSIGDKSFSAKVSSHRKDPDFNNSYNYLANVGLDNYFD